MSVEARSVGVAAHIVQGVHLELEQLEQSFNRQHAFLSRAAPAASRQCVGRAQSAGAERQPGPGLEDERPAAGRLLVIPSAQGDQLPARRLDLSEVDKHAHPLREQPGPALAADVSLRRFVEELIGQRQRPASLY